MALYTERNNLRNEIKKTYDISPSAYRLLFDFCETKFNNIAWKFPLYCPDDENIICGYDIEKLMTDLKFEIPSIMRDGKFIRPRDIGNVNYYADEDDKYDQYAIFDLIEYIYNNYESYKADYYHSFFHHYHLSFFKNSVELINFCCEINKKFKKTGLLYEMQPNGKIKRVVSNEGSLNNLKENINYSNDDILKKIIDDAISYYLKPGPDSIELAVDKIWDAFERIKTYYVDLDKKNSGNKIIEQCSCGDDEIRNILNNEYKILTDIGNSFRIRHSERGKMEFKSDYHREYFFNRCVSFLLLIAEHIK